MHQFYTAVGLGRAAQQHNMQELMQETMFLVPSGNFLGLKRSRKGIQEVSCLLWTRVFRGDARAGCLGCLGTEQSHAA